MTDQMPNRGPEVRLTRKDIAQNTAQSLLKAIPWVGEALSQFIFGPLADLRMKRVERTLAELGEAIHESGGKARVDTEEFANLLEKVLPQVSRSVNEERRAILRNLLINAAYVDPGSPKWDHADLAAELVGEIDTPGLAVLAALSKCKSLNNFMSSQPSPRIFDGGTEFTKPTQICNTINYDWAVVEEWTRRLREKRLIGFNSVDARGGFGGLQLTDLGRAVVQWAQRPAA